MGLCCVAPAFGAGADVSVTKPAGQPCSNLAGDDRCTIHTRLRAEGFGGCVAYECFGAGQHVTQVTFAGRSWRDDPKTAEQMFAIFGVVETLHELRWCTGEALLLDLDEPLRSNLAHVHGELSVLAEGTVDTLHEVDTGSLRVRVDDLLRRASARAQDSRPDDRDRSRADPIVRTSEAVTCGVQRWSPTCIGADLRDADLRGADLRGADLSDCLFLIQPQVEAARGESEVHPRAKFTHERSSPTWRGGPPVAKTSCAQ